MSSNRRYSNRFGLPKISARARIAVSERYSMGSYPKTGRKADSSITKLLTPPRIVQLLKKHESEIVTDVSDMWFTFRGSLAHLMLELASDRIPAERLIESLRAVFMVLGTGESFDDVESLREALKAAREQIAEYDASRVSGEVKELRLYASLNGWLISGQIDMIEDRICDLKWSNVQRFKDGVPPDYDWQLQGYFWLCWENRDLLKSDYQIDFEKIQGLALHAIYADWSPTASLRQAEYPQREEEVFPIVPKPIDEIKGYFWERIEAHKQARVRLPLCTDEERWKDPPKWAVVKKTQERAYRLAGSAAEAESIRQSLSKPDAYEVEYRAAIPTRCKGVGTRKYCPVRDFCDQFQQEEKQGHTFYQPAKE